MAIYNGGGGSTTNYRQYQADAAYNNTINSLSNFCWIKPMASAPALGSFASKGPGSSNGDWNLGNVSSTSNWRAGIFTNAALRTAGGTSTWRVGEWHHVGFTYDPGNNLRLWVNGFNEATTTNAGDGYTSSTDAVRLFSRNGGSPFDGQVGAYGFWNVPLLSEEIKFMAAGGDFRSVRPEAAMLIDPCDDLNRRELVREYGDNVGTLSITDRPYVLQPTRWNDPGPARPHTYHPRRKRYALRTPVAASTFQPGWFMPFFAR